jgi:NDP-sugar pyrophosphorylase family protein
MNRPTFKTDDPRPVEEIDVVILCGGLGTRLRAASHGEPKGLVMIHGRPFLQILIESIARFGFRRFILCVGYLSHRIREHFLHLQDDSITLVYSEEKGPLGTGGALKNCEALVRGRHLLVWNGDTYGTLRPWDLLRFHRDRDALASLALAEGSDDSNAGLVSLDGDGRIQSFLEKGGTSGGGYQSAGIYLLKREFLSHIPAGRPVSIERDVFPSLLQERVFGYRSDLSYLDIGTPERLERFRALYPDRVVRR